jgi:Domain of unknown function (DUF4402)
MFQAKFLRLSAALALCALPELAAAATPQQQATATATLIRPLTVTKIQDMDFGDLSAGAGGTAVLEPNADTFSTTGGVTRVGGSPMCAEFAGAAQSNSVVNIKIPTGTVTLTRVGGTQTMTVSNFTLQGQSKRTLAKSQSFTFRVGGTLNVAASQVEGVYTGKFDVTVQYP